MQADFSHSYSEKKRDSGDPNSHGGWVTDTGHTAPGRDWNLSQITEGLDCDFPWGFAGGNNLESPFMVSTLNGPNLFSNIEQNTAFTTTQFDTSSIPINPDSALTFPPPHQQIPSTAVREAAPKLVNPGRKAPDPTIETESPRPFACPHNGCKWSFKQTRDLSRHTRTVHAGDSAKTLVCHEDNCDRAGKPFSRRDNYVKHRRNVHGISSGATTKGKRKVRELEHQLSASPGDTTPSRSRATGYQDVGSVTDDSDVSEEELGGISRETLIKMYLREKRRRRDLERKMAAQRRRQRAMFSKLLEARLDEETD